MNVKENVLTDFKEFMMVNMRLRPETVKHTIEDTRRFIKSSSSAVTNQKISNYLKGYINHAPKTYNQQLTSLRRFIRDFLGLPELVSSFKMAPIDSPIKTADLTKVQVRKGFHAQQDALSRALYLFTAMTGLRKGEILNLKKDDVHFDMRAVVPNHFTRKKRSGVTFYNEETERWLKKYLNLRKDKDPRMFIVSERYWREIWKRASDSAKTSITAQGLRFWFSTEMGERGVPDRYVDVFQGRAPRSVIAKHYTGKGIQRLRRIYEKAGLTVLS